LLANGCKARVLNLPENQAKLATGEGIFKGFDPTTDPAYLSNYNTNIYGPGSRYGQGYEEPYYGGCAVAHVKPLQQLVAPTGGGSKDYGIDRRVSAVLDSEVVIDNKVLTGVKDEAGLDRYNGRKGRLGETKLMLSSSKSASKKETGGFTSLNRSTYASSLQSNLSSGESSTSESLQTSPTKNEDKSGSGAPRTRSPYVPSYSAMNNAKKKKDNGNEFMRTKAKHFDDWLKRMKREPLPQRPRGVDGKYTISRFKQKSEAIKALTTEDDKSLNAFIKTKEKALGVVEQTGTADPSWYDDDGMLVVKPDASFSNPKNQSVDSKRKGSEEIGAEDEDAYSGNEDFDATSSPKQQCTSRYAGSATILDRIEQDRTGLSRIDPGSIL
jgi:hypothetical protein